VLPKIELTNLIKDEHKSDLDVVAASNIKYEPGSMKNLNIKRSQKTLDHSNYP
jgi:hypothetical protein